MVGIYKFTNKINGMSYIGQSVDVERRYKEHQNIGREDTLFHQALREFGFDNFKFEVIEECDICKLNDREMFYIFAYETLAPYGYNVSMGGDSGHLMRLENYEDLYRIRDMLKNTDLTNIEIGKIFNVSDQIISDINNGRVWRMDGVEYPIRQKKEKKDYYCVNCGNKLYEKTVTGLCSECYLDSVRRSKPSKEDLLLSLFELNFSQVSKKYGVSGSTIRKWCRSYEISDKAKDYKKSKAVEKLQSKILAKEEVEYIRRHYIPRHREFGSRALARKYNVNHSTISKIVNHKSHDKNIV